jgi:hypothetical protein
MRTWKVILMVLCLTSCCFAQNDVDKTAEKPPVDGVPLPIELPKPRFYTGPAPPKVQLDHLRPRPEKCRPPFYAPKGVVNVARGKPVWASDLEPVIGELEMITDGVKAEKDGAYLEIGPLTQWVQIDLGAPYNIHAVLFWHYLLHTRAYLDVVVGLADDKDFSQNVRLIFNNDHDNSSGLGKGSDPHYVESHEGELVDAKGMVARYVRLYSRGNSANEMNHYCEVEVFGLPVNQPLEKKK